MFTTHAPPSSAELGTQSLYEWLRSTPGLDIVGGLEPIEAAIAPSAICKKLQLTSGSPVLVARRLAKTKGGLSVEFAITTYRADRYRFRVEL